METGNIGLLALIALVSFVLSFIGASVGLILGHLRLPLLIAYLRSPGGGAATNLVISGLGALGGTVRHVREGRVSLVGLAVMGIPSVVGAIVAVLIFVQINPLWSYLAIGIMLVVSGVNLIHKKPAEPPPDEISVARRMTIEVLIGLVLGALAAITGLMLGSLRLPMMIRYLRIDPKVAVGTNMAVGCVTGLVGAATAFLAGGVFLNWLILAIVVPPTIIGGYSGGWLTGRFSKEGVQKMAGWIVALSGALLIGQAATLASRKSNAEVPPVLVDDSEYTGWFDFDQYDTEEDEDTYEYDYMLP